MGVYTVYYIEQTILNRRKYVKKITSEWAAAATTAIAYSCATHSSNTHTDKISG